MKSHDIKAVRSLVRADQKYKRFKKAAQSNPNLVLPFEDLHDELRRLHSTRQVRVLSRRDVDFTATVIDAMLQDQSTRSRCTEILASCISISGTFAETLNNLRDYLMLEYGGNIGTRTTKEERKQFMVSLLRPFYRYLHDVSQLQEHARYVIDDIDKAGFTYRNLIEGIKLLGRPETI